MTNSDTAPGIPHQNFKDIAPFGKSNLSEITFKEGNDYVHWPLPHDTLEKNFMSIWYLFHLHVQTIVLEAFIQRIYWKFYPVNIHFRIQTIIEDQLKNFSSNQPDNEQQNFASFSDSIDRLREGIVSAIENNYLTPAEIGTLKLDDDDDDEILKQVTEKLQEFNDIINLQLNELQKKLAEIQSDTYLAYEMMKYNGPKNLDTELDRNKIYSKHDEKTVFSSFQGKGSPRTLEGRKDLGPNCHRV